MTTKSPASTCGANWGLCLPRSSCAVWLASRPSTTSVASMTCQARVMSPGLGEYVRTRLTCPSSDRAGGWWDRLTEHGRLGLARRFRGPGHARTNRPRAPAGHDTSRRTPSSSPLAGSRRAPAERPSDDFAEPSGGHVVDRAADLAAEQVRRLPDPPHRLPD